MGLGLGLTSPMQFAFEVDRAQAYNLEFFVSTLFSAEENHRALTHTEERGKVLLRRGVGASLRRRRAQS